MTATRDLLDYINASPTPYHCVHETARQLVAAGFTELDETAKWSLAPGSGHYLVRGGSILAFRVGTSPAAEAGFRLIGAHTDSPNLRLKPKADVTKSGYQQLGVEVYGGVLNYTWLDRDLGLAGRVMVKDAAAVAGVSPRFIDVRDKPILRVASLAIHLNRSIRTDGLKLNAQKHLVPMLGIAPEGKGKDTATDDSVLKGFLAERLNVEADAILGWDLSLVDVVDACLGGLRDEFVFAPRLDNQASCHAALAAIIAAKPSAATQLIALHDHEEVGSQSATGAEGPLVEWTLRRLAADTDDDTETGAFQRAIAASYQVSADMAHAVHPNYADRHEPDHKPMLNAGPVIKLNQNQRYATDGETAALFAGLCEAADVPYQRFVNRTDLACGSTIGPISSARLGVRTVDVGNPMLSMHSIREQCGAADHPRMIEVMRRFLEV